MLYSEKIKLILSGVKMEDIKALEEEEAKEKAAEEAAKAAGAKSAVELVKELEEKLKSKEDELTKLNSQIVAINNKRTVSDNPPTKATAADVMKDLFARKEKKEELNNGN